MRPIGKLVAELRRARGLSQAELGRAAGISGQTVKKLEQGGTLRGGTLAMIYRGLNASSPMTDQQVDEFKRATHLHDLPAPHEVISPSLVTPQGMALRDYTSKLPKDHARAHWVLADILSHDGASSILAVIENVAKMLGLSIDPPVSSEKDSPRMVASPPRRLPDGSTEQRFTHLDISIVPDDTDEPRAKHI